MRPLTSLLWITMAVCLLAGGVLLLLGCDFATPAFLNFGGAFCPKKVDLSGLQREHDRQDSLLGRLHEAQLRLAEIPDCPPPSPPAPPQPPPGPKVGKRGKLEITLWWETRDDLDLIVRCDGKEINPANSETMGPGICGDGFHDVDANRMMRDTTLEPKEHVFWNADIPQTTYEVLVVPSQTKDLTPIPYHVRVNLDDEIQVCSGQVSWDRKLKQGNAQIALRFTPTHPLPACINEDRSMSECSGPKCKR